jgi:outer membrane protein assembly factor BamB
MKLLILIFSYINAFISRDSSTIIFEYNLKNVREIVFIYNYKNKDYIIGVIKNFFKNELKDKFVWMTKQKWEGKGDLKVLVKKNDGNVDKYFISGKSLKTIDFLKKKEEGYFINHSLLKNRGPDKYAWRNAGYNPQHTNYYPFKIFPPLERKWVKSWGEPGADITMISAAIAHNMIFIVNVPEDPWYVICAIDIETREIIWKRSFISNVFTSALCEGESLLFVGTCIGFTPDTNTTFACLDPFTGAVKWSKRGLGTVEYSPISVDTFVYVPALSASYNNQWEYVHAYTLKGKLLWEGALTGDSPGYFDKRIYGFKEWIDFLPNDTSFFYCRDALNGNVLWKYNCKNTMLGGLWPTIYLKRVVFDFSDTILALDVYTGSKLWFINYDWQVSANDNKIFNTTGYIRNDSTYSKIIAFSIFNGEKIWEKELGIQGIFYSSVPPAPPISYPDILWYNDPRYIYALNIKNGEVLYKSEIFFGNNQEACIFFPILYKNYVIISRYSALSVYQGDTISNQPPPQDTFPKFYIFYGEFFTPILYIYLNKKDYVFIDIFDEIGRRLKNIYNGELEKGEHRIYFDKDIKNGKYFIILKTSKYRKKFKFIKIGR